MARKIDLTGRQFGKLTVIKSTKRRNKSNRSLWKCQCECGKIKYVTTDDLKGLKVTSCGCRYRLELKGQQFGRLTVLRKQMMKRHGRAYWLCQCQCGKKVFVKGTDLTLLKTRSCGCYRREKTRQTFRKHGDSGRILSSLYKVWAGMKQRCLNKNCKQYKYYGGRGIKLSKVWHDYVAFKEWALASGWRKNLEIDRIDNDGNYCPENCRWVTRKENSRNTSRTIWKTINGETKSLAEWCEIYKVSYRMVLQRVSKGGWSLEDALVTPVKQRNQRNS